MAMTIDIKLKNERSVLPHWTRLVNLRRLLSGQLFGQLFPSNIAILSCAKYGWLKNLDHLTADFAHRRSNPQPG